MENREKIAIVTGANRGIGLEICRQLASIEEVKVVLTSRDEKKGKEAVTRLSQEGLNVDFHGLDVTNEKSIKALVHWIEDKYGRCDILINNAGIFPDTQTSSAGGNWPSIFETSIETMQKGIETNVYGPMMLCQYIVPLMKKNNYGRIVNLSSGMGQLTNMNGKCPSYRVSKTAINALTRIFSEELLDFNILVNSMCPGWVKTDMGGPGATRELPEGAQTAVFLATLPDEGPRGKFFRDKKEFEW